MSQKSITTSEAQSYASQQSNINRDNDPIYVELVTCKVKLLIEKPFFGVMLVRMDLIEADWCRTAATDGRRFYYNREFIKGLKREELIYLMGHEILHCVFDHLGRKGNRDKDIWNMATDYVINSTLNNEKLGKMPEGGLIDSAYTYEMSADEVYDLLKKKSVTIQLPLDDHLELDDDEDNEEEDSSGSNEGNSGDGDDGDGEEDGNGQKPKAGAGSGKGQKTAKVTVVGKNGVPKLSKEEIEKIRAEMKSALLQTAQQVGAGNVPLGVQRLIQELTQPKLDWRTLLDAHIRSALKDDYTFQKIGRRTWGAASYGNYAILPAQNFMDRVEVVCAIDASGSTTQQMVTDFLSETVGIMQTFRDYKITLFCFDTEVYNVKEFTPDNEHDIYEYQIKGGGGTMFEEVFAFMKREGIEPHRLAFFTDGYPNAGWGDPDYCDTIFIIHGNKDIQAPFGITCHYEAKSH